MTTTANPIVTQLSQGLNPLVDKIRATHPGAYDDLSDAELTAKVVAKYPQYGDLAAPYDKTNALAMNQAHGAVSLMGHPASSQAQDTAFDEALKSPSAPKNPLYLSGPTPEVPKGMDAVAHIAESIPAVAGAAASFVPAEGLISGASNIPTAAKAGAALRDVKAVAGGVPIDISEAGNTALEMMTQKERGGQLPQAVRQLVSRFTDPSKGPITYEEAKDFQSNISNLSANEKMALKPNTVRLLGQLNSNLKDALESAADTQGKGQQFVNAMKDYHNAMRIRGMSDAAKEAAWRAALGAAGVYGAKKIWDAGQ
jgi:hypothetical protein